MVLRLLNSRLGAAGFWDEWDKAFLSDDWSHWRENIVPHKEHEDHYEYWINLAGFKKEDIAARIDDGRVHITAKDGDSAASYSFALPDEVDASVLSAKHENGLLTITIPKLERAKAITIAID